MKPSPQHPLVAQLIAAAKGQKKYAISLAAGQSERWLNNIASGAGEPRVSSFVRLANVLGYDVVLVKRGT